MRQKLRKLISKWMRILNLHWDVEFKFADRKEDEELEGCIAYMGISPYRKATVVVASDTPEKDWEESIVHELVHLKIYECFRAIREVMRTTNSGNALWKTSDEELAQQLEQAFLEAQKRR